MKNRPLKSALITIYYANQCDRRKCTGIKLWQSFKQKKILSRHQVRFVERIPKILRYSIILNPISDKII